MKKLKKIAALTVVFTMLFSVTVNAKYYSNVKSTDKWKSLAGLTVVIETLHASGYSYSNSGSVCDVWLTTDRCYIFNGVSSENTWTAKAPNGQYAKGSYKLNFGLPTPWGTVGTSGTTHTLSILF